MKKFNIFFIIILAITAVTVFLTFRIRQGGRPEPGQKLDTLNGVYVYFNGAINESYGLSEGPSGRIYGLKYQSMEFVRRYFAEYLNHALPEADSIASDWFDFSLQEGDTNAHLNLIQYKNPSTTMPAVNDLLIFDQGTLNPMGHVAIISKTGENSIEIVQQNPGVYGKPREELPLVRQDDGWYIRQEKLIGRLRSY